MPQLLLVETTVSGKIIREWHSDDAGIRGGGFACYLGNSLRVAVRRRSGDSMRYNFQGGTDMGRFAA